MSDSNVHGSVNTPELMNMTMGELVARLMTDEEIVFLWQRGAAVYSKTETAEESSRHTREQIKEIVDRIMNAQVSQSCEDCSTLTEANERLDALAHRYAAQGKDLIAARENVAILREKAESYKKEVQYLRHYGNKDCIHQAEEAMMAGTLEGIHA